MSVLNIGDIASQNTLLNAINMKPVHQVVAVREYGLADANFIITNLMKQILLEENNKMCLVTMHNPVEHYHNVGKKINYDIMKKVQNGDVISIDPLKSITDSLNSTNCLYLYDNKEEIVKKLFLSIKDSTNKLLNVKNVEKVYLVIDDISHLIDLGVDVKHIFTFINCCVNAGATLIIGSHVDNENDAIISNALEYIASLSITVSPLKTGFSRDVSGVIEISDYKQTSRCRSYHYKAFDRGIKVFPIGDSLHH